jgi:hypothetical protein
MSIGILPQSYIDARAPKYSADPRVSYLLLQAQQEVGENWGQYQGKGQALLMLHWMAMDDRSGQQNGNSIGGTVQSEQEGSLKRSYMVDFSLTKDFPDYSQTRWGMEFIQTMKKAVVHTPFNRMSANDPTLAIEPIDRFVR